MSTKISDLPATTTPASTVEIPVVDGSTTKKTTASSLLGSTLGWFEVGHNGADQTSIGTTVTKILVDAALTTQGGYDYLPSGISSGDVYDASTSRIKTDWLSTGQAVLFRVAGELTTSAVNTSAKALFNLYDSDDNLIETFSRGVGFFKTAGASDFSATELMVFNAAETTTGSYMEVELQFDSGASNEINMGSFTMAVIK